MVIRYFDHSYKKLVDLNAYINIFFVLRIQKKEKNPGKNWNYNRKMKQKFHDSNKSLVPRSSTKSCNLRAN